MSKSNSKVKNEYLKKLEPVCEAIAQALTTVVEVDKQNEKEINDVLIDAEKEMQECENAVENMTELSDHIRDIMLPSIEDNLSELDQLYNIINTMHDKVIPSINEDLTNIESLVTSLERLHSRDQPTAMNAFLYLISSSTDSNDDKRNQTLPSLTLHDKDEFLKIIREFKYESNFNNDNDNDNDDNIDNNNDNDNNNNNIDISNDADTEDNDKNNINRLLGLAMPITLGDNLRNKKNPI